VYALTDFVKKNSFSIPISDASNVQASASSAPAATRAAFNAWMVSAKWDTSSMQQQACATSIPITVQR